MSKRYTSYNWKEIQEFYDNGKTLKEVHNKFGCGHKSRKKAEEAGLFVVRDKRKQQVSKTKLEDHNRLQELNWLYHCREYSIKDLLNAGFDYHEYTKAKETGLLKVRSRSEAAKLAIKKYGPTVMGQDAKQRLSKRQSLKNTGGKCKWFNVAGQQLQGTWERDIAIKFEELKIKWYKPRLHLDVMSYSINGKTKNYTPDFYLPDHDVYLEVKGYWWGNDKEKMLAVINQHSDKKFVIVELNEYKRIMEGELVW